MAILLIISINFFAFCGIQASRIIISLYALSLGANSATVGGILATMYIFPVVLSWPIGVLSERFGAARVLLVGVGSPAVGMTIAHFFPSLVSLYIAGTLCGLTICTVTVVGQNLVGALSTPENRTRNFSNYSLGASLTIFVGPVLAGLSIDHLGHSSACLVAVLVFLLSLLALTHFRGVLPRGERTVRARANLLDTLRDRRLWPVFVVSSLSQVSNDVYQAFLPIHGHGAGMSASAIGAVMASCAVGTIGVRALLTRLVKRMGSETRLLSIAFVAAGVAYLFMPLAPGSVLLAAVSFCFGAALGCIQPLTLLLMFASADHERAGEAVGLRLTINNIARILTPAIFGVIATAAGVATVFWVTGALMGLGWHTARPKANRGSSS
jgi:MFS family permease